MIRQFALTLALVFAWGCPSTQEPGPGTAPEPTPEPGGEEPAPEPAAEEPSGEGATFAAQVEKGGELYGKNCASCHGASGEGGKAPPVVGLAKGALPLDPPKGAKFRKVQFKTVLDLGEWVMKNMPPGDADKLSQEEYLAILAFDLKANGVDLDEPLTVDKAKTLDIPR